MPVVAVTVAVKVAVKVVATAMAAAVVVVVQAAHKALAKKVQVVLVRKVKANALNAPTTHRAILVMSRVIHPPHASTPWRPTPSVVTANPVARRTTHPAVNPTRCAPAWT